MARPSPLYLWGSGFSAASARGAPGASGPCAVPARALRPCGRRAAHGASRRRARCACALTRDCRRPQGSPPWRPRALVPVPGAPRKQRLPLCWLLTPSSRGRCPRTCVRWCGQSPSASARPAAPPGSEGPGARRPRGLGRQRALREGPPTASGAKAGRAHGTRFRPRCVLMLSCVQTSSRRAYPHGESPQIRFL